MKDQKNNSERPEVYALRQEGLNWQISRRDFLKTAGIGAAAVSAGLNSGCSRRNNSWKGPSESLDVLCPQVVSHKYIITQLLLTADGKYLISNDRHDVKCWDFNSSALVRSYNANAAYIRVGQIGGINSVIRYTLPCGAAIPEGGVCTCNCVAGRGGCACDSHGKSNGNGRSNGGASHYWHPN